MPAFLTEGSAFVLGQAAPDASVLAGAEGPVEAGVGDFAVGADRFGFLDLAEGGRRRTDREEQAGILAAAGGPV